MQHDLFIGGQWISALLQPTNTSIEAQVTLRHQLVMICHAYYRSYLGIDRGLFLHLHDFQNICQLFNLIHENVSETIGRRNVFLIYCYTLTVYGNAEVPDHGRVWIDERMAEINSLPSPDLPIDHYLFQVCPF